MTTVSLPGHIIAKKTGSCCNFVGIAGIFIAKEGKHRTRVKY